MPNYIGVKLDDMSVICLVEEDFEVDGPGFMTVCGYTINWDLAEEFTEGAADCPGCLEGADQV